MIPVAQMHKSSMPTRFNVGNDMIPLPPMFNNLNVLRWKVLNSVNFLQPCRYNSKSLHSSENSILENNKQFSAEKISSETHFVALND